METSNIRIRRDAFDRRRKDLGTVFSKLEQKRKDFVEKFPQEGILALKLDEFVIGRGSKESFCYLLENELKSLGDIHGATSLKFGIYFGKTKTDPAKIYRFTRKFGDNYAEAFENVKGQIFYLLRAGRNDDYGAISDNKLSPMFKGKILVTYFPEKNINIFADRHLNYYLEVLNLHYPETADETEKRRILIGYKKTDATMAKWSNVEFSYFLWSNYHA